MYVVVRRVDVVVAVVVVYPKSDNRAVNEATQTHRFAFSRFYVCDVCLAALCFSNSFISFCYYYYLLRGTGTGTAQCGIYNSFLIIFNIYSMIINYCISLN